MTTLTSFPAMLERFFTQRLMQQREPSHRQFLSRHLPSVPEVRRTAVA